MSVQQIIHKKQWSSKNSVNTPDGKENPKLVKKYYKSLIQSFDNKIGEILKELGELNK